MSGTTTHDVWNEDEREAARQAHLCYVWALPTSCDASEQDVDRCAAGCPCKTIEVAKPDLDGYGGFAR